MSVEFIRSPWLFSTQVNHGISFYRRRRRHQEGFGGYTLFHFSRRKTPSTGRRGGEDEKISLEITSGLIFWHNLIFFRCIFLPTSSHSWRKKEKQRDSQRWREQNDLYVVWQPTHMYTTSSCFITRVSNVLLKIQHERVELKRLKNKWHKFLNSFSKNRLSVSLNSWKTESNKVIYRKFRWWQFLSNITSFSSSKEIE